MKKWFFVFLLLTPLSNANLLQAQDGIVKFFNAYLEDERFTVVYITPKMFQMIAKLDAKDPDYQNVKNVLQDLKGLRILTTEDKNAGQFYREAISKFNSNEYELLMKVRDKSENVHFWTKENANGTVAELILLVGGNKEFTMISFVGNIDLQKIAKLSDKLNIEGAEHLKDLKKKE